MKSSKEDKGYNALLAPMSRQASEYAEGVTLQSPGVAAQRRTLGGEPSTMGRPSRKAAN